MTISTIMHLPALRFLIYIKCFSRVLLTYWNVFFIFLPILIGVFAIILNIFSKNLGGKIEEFHSIGNAMLKFIFMFTGEIDLQPSEVIGFIQIIAMILLIIFFINLSNLILAIVINDTRELMQKSKLYNLKLIGEKYVEFAKGIRIFYAWNIE